MHLSNGVLTPHKLFCNSTGGDFTRHNGKFHHFCSSGVCFSCAVPNTAHWWIIGSTWQFFIVYKGLEEKAYTAKSLRMKILNWNIWGRCWWLMLIGVQKKGNSLQVQSLLSLLFYSNWLMLLFVFPLNSPGTLSMANAGKWCSYCSLKFEIRSMYPCTMYSFIHSCIHSFIHWLIFATFFSVDTCVVSMISGPNTSKFAC